MALDEGSARAFLINTRAKAGEIVAQSHISDDVKSIVKDLLQAMLNFENLQNQSVGQSADSRVLKKRLEQAKVDMRGMESKIEAHKKAMVAIVEDVKVVALEATAIAKRHAALNDADNASAQRIRSSAQNMADTLVQAIKA